LPRASAPGAIVTESISMQPLNSLSRDDLATVFGTIAVGAGQLILKARDRGACVQTKTDGSPVTDADLEAGRFIHARLSAVLPGLRVITEETIDLADSSDDSLDHFVLVDPLDGTREFIAGRDEFTVNIALISGREPVVGAVYAPAKSSLYIGSEKAFWSDIRSGQIMPPLSGMRELKASPVRPDDLRAVISRSHLDKATENWLEQHRVSSHVPAGSSLKFCAVAEGSADVYPRCAPTMEWDTAAGHAVLAAAGGRVVSPDGSPLRYGKIEAGFRNSAFVAWGAPR
jgi:3'(2'), 5'-bisphosphate nucleotidase